MFTKMQCLKTMFNIVCHNRVIFHQVVVSFTDVGFNHSSHNFHRFY